LQEKREKREIETNQLLFFAKIKIKFAKNTNTSIKSNTIQYSYAIDLLRNKNLFANLLH